ncbi:MAG: LPS assembly lipoprotein LptE [Bacteroidota bacterium]
MRTKGSTNLSLLFAALAAILFTASGCKVSYSFSGADVPAEAKTFSVEYFKVTAPLANPVYPQKITERLKDQINTSTRLELVKSNGDLQYSGTITQYNVLPVAITGNETAGSNRFTITIKVNYINTFDEKKNFERDFTMTRDFPATQSLTEVETGLIEAINNQLAIDIFNASLGNW